MYHPGKVIEVLRAGDRGVLASDGTTQVVLRMWDENVLTMLVAPKIADKVKDGQTVLVDYRPDPKLAAPVALHTVVKILDGKKAEGVWKAYHEAFERQRQKASRAAQPPPQSYIG